MCSSDTAKAAPDLLQDPKKLCQYKLTRRHSLMSTNGMRTRVSRLVCFFARPASFVFTLQYCTNLPSGPPSGPYLYRELPGNSYFPGADICLIGKDHHAICCDLGKGFSIQRIDMGGGPETISIPSLHTE